MAENNNTRRFSYTDPILYNGAMYPTARAYMDNGNGKPTEGTMFVGDDGQYYTMSGDGRAYHVMLQHELPEVEVMPDKLKNDIPQRQAMMRAAGYDVPQDGSWDLYQQSVWNELTTKPKEYPTTFEGLYQGLRDRVTGDYTYQSDPLNQGEIREYNPDNIDWDKTRRSQSKVVNALSGTWAPGLAAATLPPALLSAPVATVATAVGGGIGGYAANKTSEAITGRDIGTNVAMHTPLTPGLGEVLNPGYTLGGLGTERRMLDAFYNQITPMGYSDVGIVPGTLSKTQEIGLALRDFFTPKRIDTSVKTQPAWKQRLNQKASDLSPQKSTADFRDDAWRLAMRQKPRTIDLDGKPHTLYVKNPDGTYSYDLEYIREVEKGLYGNRLGRRIQVMNPTKPLHEGLNTAVGQDMVSSNGGNVGIEFNLPKDWGYDYFSRGYSSLVPQPSLRYKDKWDLQFLQNPKASYAPRLTEFLTEHPNVFTNYLRNIDAVQMMGGKPFVLDTTIPSNTLRDIVIPTNK